MSMCARILFGIGGCLGLMSTIFLIIAVAAPMFATKMTGDADEKQTVISYGLTKAGTGCSNQICRDDYKKTFKTEDAYVKNHCKKKNDKTGTECSPDYAAFMCWCDYGDKDKMEKKFKDSQLHKTMCDPNSYSNKDSSGCDKFEYKDAEEVFDALWSSRGVTLIMLIVAIIFGIFMTITAYGSAALLHPIIGWVAVCLCAMTMLFSIIGCMTGAKFGNLSLTQNDCGNYPCFHTHASHDFEGNKWVATFWLSQILTLVSAIQSYIALCLVLIGAFVAQKAGGADGGSLGEKLT